MDGPKFLNVRLGDGLQLSSSVNPDSLCDSLGSPIWQWTVNSTFAFPSGADLNSNLYLLGSDLVSGGLATYTPYLFKLTGSFAGQTISSSASVVVSIAGSELLASISGPSGWVPANKLIMLDVLETDPDSSSTAFNFAWRCSRSDSAPCFTTNQQVRPFSSFSKPPLIIFFLLLHCSGHSILQWDLDPRPLNPDCQCPAHALRHCLGHRVGPEKRCGSYSDHPQACQQWHYTHRCHYPCLPRRRLPFSS